MLSPLNARLSTLEFLWSSSSKVQSRVQCSKDLRAVQNQLREKCLNLAKGGGGGVDCSSAFQESEICRYCGTPWSDGSFRLKVSPHKYKMKQLKMKLISCQRNLSKYNKYLLGLFNKRRDNVLEKRCMTCKKTTKVGLTKPVPQKKEDEANSIEASETSLQEVRKKKKKKSQKDRFSGLVPSAVVGARMSQGFRRDSVASIGGDQSTRFSIDSNSALSSVVRDSSFPTTESKAGSFICLEETNHEPESNDRSLCVSGEICCSQEDSIKNNSTLTSGEYFDDSPNGCAIDSKKKNHEVLSLSNNVMKKRSKNRKKKHKNSGTSNSFISFSDKCDVSEKSIPKSDSSQKKTVNFSPLLLKSNKNLKGATNCITPGSKRPATPHLTDQAVNLNKKSIKKKKKSSVADFLNFL